jgi:L-rhamnose mutarotase
MATMRTVVLLSVLHEGQEAAYEAAHERIPQDLYHVLTSAGVRDWAIWRDGRKLLHLVDVDDYEAMAAQLVRDPVNDRWQAEMAAYVDYFEDLQKIPVLSNPTLVWSMDRQVTDTTNER